MLTLSNQCNQATASLGLAIIITKTIITIITLFALPSDHRFENTAGGADCAKVVAPPAGH